VTAGYFYPATYSNLGNFIPVVLGIITPVMTCSVFLEKRLAGDCVQGVGFFVTNHFNRFTAQILYS